ncbi:MAG: helix-turn-helix domain-containing protein [Acidobacteria bacterium]|nr:helix-turn-helix domain-containing protein [Acidobacteriota bacterium]
MAEASRVLRAARERAGLTLEQMSARTKIKVTLLQAIEGGEFERLPGEFFTRAFLRTYAREVHLSPDEIVREYDASRPVHDLGPDHAAIGRSEPGNGLRGDEASRARSWPFRVAWPLAAASVVLLLLAISVLRRPAPGQATEPGAVGTIGTSAASEPPAAEATPAPGRLTLEIRPTAVLWVTATADGERAIYRLLQPGERVTVEGRNELTFRVGNAGAFEYSLNGAPGKSVGRRGEVREVQVTRENYRTFLR